MEEKATLDYLIIKIGLKTGCRSLIEFSTMSNGSTYRMVAVGETVEDCCAWLVQHVERVAVPDVAVNVSDGDMG